MKKILIVAGGTGGHIFPALAIAEELQLRGISVSWLGSKEGMEENIVATRCPFFSLNIKGVRNKTLMTRLLAPWHLFFATVQALRIMQQIKPDVVLAMGGFVSAAGGLAAWISRRKLLVHEQNAIAGSTNRKLAKFAEQIMQAYPDAFAKSVNAHTVGNPVRPEIKNVPAPELRFAGRTGPLRILLLGGSQGARPLNRCMMQLLSHPDHARQISVWHQSGKSDYDEVLAFYRDHKIDVRIEPFIENMASAYEWADVVICRAGAMTVSEIAVAGCAALFVPYPYSEDNHQTKNAEHLVKNHAAKLLPQSQFTVEELWSHLQNWIENRKELITMAKNAREQAKKHTMQKMLMICMNALAHPSLSILKNPVVSSVHCIGVGGIGVGGLAEILLLRGHKVSGSDLIENQMTKWLAHIGVEIYTGHDTKHIKQADAVVYSSAVQMNNPEMIAAREKKIPLVRRGELLAELVREKIGIAVAGTHGKTTTTALIAFAMMTAGKDPTYLIGGYLNGEESPAHLGADPYCVVESDESDASFLFLNPKIAVITNIDSDHLDTYRGDFSRLRQSFNDFLDAMAKDGLAVLCFDDPENQKLISQVKCRLKTYGFDPRADYYACEFVQQGLMTWYKVKRKGLSDLEICLNLPGKHNVLNSMAALIVAEELKIDDETMMKALKQFPGVDRRFHAQGEIKLKDGSHALLFDDYGHHPREIQATLHSARLAWPDSRIVLVFQPHRYTRTRDLMDDFVEVLSSTDVLLLLDVYNACEMSIPDADGQALCQRIQQRGAIQPTYIADNEQLPKTLAKMLRTGDIVILQGAGNISAMAPKILNINKHSSHDEQSISSIS